MKIHLNHICNLAPCFEGLEFAKEQFALHADEFGMLDLLKCEELCLCHGHAGKQYYDWLANAVHQPEFYFAQADHVFANYRVGTTQFDTLEEAQALSRERKPIWPDLIHEWAPMRKITNVDGSGHSWVYLHDERYKAENPLEI